MGKNKNQNRERSQASPAAAQEPERSGTAMESPTEAMPGMSSGIPHKRGKKFGHN